MPFHEKREKMRYTFSKFKKILNTPKLTKCNECMKNCLPEEDLHIILTPATPLACVYSTHAVFCFSDVGKNIHVPLN